MREFIDRFQLPTAFKEEVLAKLNDPDFSLAQHAIGAEFIYEQSENLKEIANQMTQDNYAKHEQLFLEYGVTKKYLKNFFIDFYIEVQIGKVAVLWKEIEVTVKAQI